MKLLILIAAIILFGWGWTLETRIDRLNERASREWPEMCLTQLNDGATGKSYELWSNCNTTHYNP